MDKVTNVLSIVKGYALKKVRLILLQQKEFTGRYADCLIQAKQFVRHHNVLVQHFVIREDNVVNVVDETLSPDMQDTIRKQQAREIRKDTRLYKGKKMVVWYGHDNQLTRKLGFRYTKYHHILK
jgi:ribosomal protein S4